MAKQAFKKEDLVDLVDGCPVDEFEVMVDRLIGTSRWSIHYELVFKDKASGKFYTTNYSKGATEQQGERPFECEPDLVPCDEVRPVEKVVTVYEPSP